MKERHLMETSPVRSPECRSFGSVAAGWRLLAPAYWMWAAFIIAFVLAVGVLIIFGVGERGTAIALRATARWSFLLFWFAYVGGSIAWLCGPRFDGLARRGRELGLAYASAQLVHVGLVLWIIHIATGPSGAMVFFWIGIFCTYLLALFSWPRLRDALGPRLWRMFRTIALEYIAIAFAADFIVGPLHTDGLGKLRPLYLPFALMLVVGAGLRVARFSHEKLRRPRATLPLSVGGSPAAARLGSKPGEDRLIVWPVFVFLAAIMVLLALDDAIWGFFESALALYGPVLAILGVYVLLKSVVRGRGFIWS
ncbi:MAG: hypothetical protein WBD95_01800 [Xanthobacteraceae bacterium]